MTLKRVLFVCTGNTCRSPMAESILRKLAEDHGLDLEVKSAGVLALNGQKMSNHSATVLKNRGIDPQAFASQEVNETLVEWADVILTMTAHHKRHLLAKFPQAVDRIYTLKEYALIDDEAVLEKLRERESLLAELQIKQATNQAITEEDKDRLLRLELELPNVDIPDPFGGSLKLYENVAAEIEESLQRIVRRWKSG